ncbi:hypothetical protein JOC95_000363 [Bacillus tianshenii]|uniref:NERD domain-containing protein n=1 Tax=Sutcliffiella tianshenii TaxID=1463404 RepID=A0ABS2NV33_9BACI|nr:NERD domain-containing protein [Bacillus tianshenii]MBM7618521.1 hypothetical protein [Bacillus tianshenii]
MRNTLVIAIIIVFTLSVISIAPGIVPFIFLGGMIYLKTKYPIIKGAIGEWYVNKELSKLGPMYKVYHDLYIPNEEGGTSQVDHVVTSPFGIFVIETKHYDGWIFGKENQRHWTQVIYKRKEKFLNPIWQNYGHIEGLKKYLGEHKFYSIIVFSSRSTLKMEDNFNSARVIQIPQLNRVIKEWSQQSQMSQVGIVELQRINQALEQLTIKDRKQKRLVHKKHVEAIKNKQRANEVAATAEKVPPPTISPASITSCPKCGGQLTRKKGKYGSFFGCSQYPTCRHTEKVS